jgi:hypothetical protein
MGCRPGAPFGHSPSSADVQKFGHDRVSISRNCKRGAFALSNLTCRGQRQGGGDGGRLRDGEDDPTRILQDMAVRIP